MERRVLKEQEQIKLMTLYLNISQLEGYSESFSFICKVRKVFD